MEANQNPALVVKSTPFHPPTQLTSAEGSAYQSQPREGPIRGFLFTDGVDLSTLSLAMKAGITGLLPISLSFVTSQEPRGQNQRAKG